MHVHDQLTDHWYAIDECWKYFLVDCVTFSSSLKFQIIYEVRIAYIFYCTVLKAFISSQPLNAKQNKYLFIRSHQVLSLILIQLAYLWRSNEHSMIIFWANRRHSEFLHSLGFCTYNFSLLFIIYFKTNSR